MRDYGKVSPLFWTGNTGRVIRKQGQTAQLAALYLMTAPGATMLGVYHLPAVTLGHAIGSPFEGALQALRSLSEVGFCTYDEESEWVWVHEMARYQIDDALDPKDNRVKSVAKDWLAIPQLPFLAEFLARYGEVFHLPARRFSSSPFEAPSKPLRSQEQEQEQEQEKEKALAPSPADAGSPPEFRVELPEPAFEFITNTGQLYPIYDEQVQAWRSDFPGIDVDSELRKARAWCEASPRQRKTKAGMNRFLVGWLGRAQDRGRPSAPSPNTPRLSLAERAAADEATARRIYGA